MAIRNFHIPLPDKLYDQLRKESKLAGVPATRLARSAIEAWLREEEKRRISEAIAEYAALMAGTPADLDEELSEAALEHLAELEST